MGGNVNLDGTIALHGKRAGKRRIDQTSPGMTVNRGRSGSSRTAPPAIDKPDLYLHDKNARYPRFRSIEGSALQPAANNGLLHLAVVRLSAAQLTT
ncbi:hypothetical protein PUN28_003530 [Cardiocondyla obscurior]|uniref:Uncharacterized protein n=1 Tax=Cardiocondyla obscurior TaxID=286306 RepID=A0AAW2GLB0_9HYME